MSAVYLTISAVSLTIPAVYLTIFQLFTKIQSLFADYPELASDFAAFLSPHQAVSCGCFMANHEFIRARTFLRKLEVSVALVSQHKGARCSSVVRAFAHGAMGRRIDPSWSGPIELFLVQA